MHIDSIFNGPREIFNVNAAHIIQYLLYNKKTHIRYVVRKFLFTDRVLTLTMASLINLKNRFVRSQTATVVRLFLYLTLRVLIDVLCNESKSIKRFTFFGKRLGGQSSVPNTDQTVSAHLRYPYTIWSPRDEPSRLFYFPTLSHGDNV